LALIGALKWSKILAAPKSRGKNFGRVFFDVFVRPEFDPVVGFVKHQPNRALPHLMTLVVRDCIPLKMGPRGKGGDYSMFQPAYFHAVYAQYECHSRNCALNSHLEESRESDATLTVTIL